MSDNVAYLSSNKDYVIFAFADKTIRFKGPYSLVRFKDVVEWDNGYLVVNVYYEHSSEPVEDYIDLVSVLDNLYIDSKSFLKHIKKVEIRYA